MITYAYILILFAHVGPMGDGNSNALTIQEFDSQTTCQAAGKEARHMAAGTVKSIEFVCVKK